MTTEDTKTAETPAKKRFTDKRHYAAIGRMVRESVERKYGKSWKSCFAREVAQSLVAREAFFLMMGGAREGMDATTLEEHGRLTYAAGLTSCGLDDDTDEDG